MTKRKTLRSGDICKVGDDLLVQLGEYDKYNKVWYCTSREYGQMTLSKDDLTRVKLP
jgi:hypothetical protein